MALPKFTYEPTFQRVAVVYTDPNRLPRHIDLRGLDLRDDPSVGDRLAEALFQAYHLGLSDGRSEALGLEVNDNAGPED